MTPFLVNHLGIGNAYFSLRVVDWQRIMTGSRTSPMAESRISETTRLLRDWAKGDKTALDQLTPRVYRELRRIAGHFMQDERAGRTLQATALAHEAYLKLIDVDNVDWQHRAHFFAIAAQVMRRILLDAARKRGAAKRGGNLPRVNLDEIPDLSAGRAGELLAVGMRRRTGATLSGTRAWRNRQTRQV